MENRKRSDKPKATDRKKTFTKDKGKPKSFDKKKTFAKDTDKVESADKKKSRTTSSFKKEGTGGKLPFKRKPLTKTDPNKTAVKTPKRVDDGTMRLNRYIANAGVCSRREADTLILSGAVAVNGVVITELGSRVNEGDKVTVGKESIKHEQKVYILMNKPKNFITSVSDPQGRKTVMQLVGKMKHRVYPVGRLDRDTT